MCSPNLSSTINFDALQIPDSVVNMSTSSNIQFDSDTIKLDNADLKRAIQIANRFLATPLVIEILKLLIDSESKQMLKSIWSMCENKIEKTPVSYVVRQPNEKHAVAWTYEVKLDNGEERLEVAINSFFQHRIHQIRQLLSEVTTMKSKPSKATDTRKEDDKSSLTPEELERERQLIVVFMGFCIFHEVAHLIIRWTGQKSTPEIFRVNNGSITKPEAGWWLELQTFRGIVKIFASPEKGNWLKNSVYKGIGFETSIKADGTELKERTKFSEKYVTDLYNLPYDNLNDVKKYIIPVFDQDLSTIANTKSIGKGESFSDEDDETRTTVVRRRLFNVLEGTVTLEDLGVSKCGYHLDD